jgi:hypothetical protein
LPRPSEVYGKSAKVPFNEETDLVMGATTRHRWAYACSKALDEFLALAHWKETKQPVIVMRFFNTVGPRQTGQYGMVVPTFVRQALSNEPITVFGDGTQQRSFTYVGDVVGALLKLMVEPAAIGKVFNVGNTEEVTIRGLAERIKERTGSSSEIVIIPYDQAYEAGFEDMPRRVPDLTKINKAIGYVPKVGPRRDHRPRGGRDAQLCRHRPDGGGLDSDLVHSLKHAVTVASFPCYFMNEAVYNAVQTLNGVAGRYRPRMGLAMPEASPSAASVPKGFPSRQPY